MTDSPCWRVVRVGPTGRETYLAARRFKPMEHFWTKYLKNAMAFTEEQAHGIVNTEAPPLSNHYMRFYKERIV